ncbi:disintegrin and metalloproteinase domain-containing protein 2-like [Vipera latastei]
MGVARTRRPSNFRAQAEASGGYGGVRARGSAAPPGRSHSSAPVSGRLWPPAPPAWAPAMAPLALPLALLAVSFVVPQGSQRSYLQVIVPQRNPAHATGNKRCGYHADFNSKEKHVMCLVEVMGAITSMPKVNGRDCYYQGYVDGYTDSIAMISSCSGLSGLIQIQNISYGIEPIESASGFHHLVFRIDYNDTGLQLSKQNYSIKWSTTVTSKKDPAEPINFAILRYVEMHVVVAKSLYDYMGSNEDVVTGKIMQLMNFVNTMFSKLNMKIILSSLELWINKDKISIIGTADQLLEQFLNWKNEHLALRPHDAAFLFVYRNKADSVGSTFAKKMCSKPISAGIAMFQNGMTLEAFSVIVAQLLGFSVGLYFDDTRACHCSGTVCLMNTRAAQSSGIKSFSSCSVKDFQNFLHSALSQCLQNKPQFDIAYRAPLCGNHVVEDGEQCDCGTVKECENHPCCGSDCTLKAGMKCAQGDCCLLGSCRLKAKGTLCRELEDSECDLKEFCNGTSAECSENHYVEDGHWCEHQTGVCMRGRCQSADRWCRKIFGSQSRSGSLQCYEEINSQKDRMGHCGSTARGYQDCQWQDLRCGKLVCDYPNRVPFFLENAAIIYAKVQNRLCVTLDYLKGPGIRDPFLIHDGTVCGDNKVCMNQKCVDRAVIRMACDAERKCHGKGKCNNRGNCHCDVGWAPPDCNVADEGGLGGSIDSTFRSGLVRIDHQPKRFSTRNWLLVGFFVFLPVVIGAILLAIKLRQALLHPSMEEEKDEGEEYDTEGSKFQESHQPESESV